MMETEAASIDQRTHWERTYAKKADFFGAEPSDFGVRAASRFEREGLTRILELGAGQGRDTFMLLQRGFVVHFFSAEKVKRLAKGYDLLVLNEFEDPSPPFTKKLYEVVLRKPHTA